MINNELRNQIVNWMVSDHPREIVFLRLKNATVLNVDNNDIQHIAGERHMSLADPNLMWYVFIELDEMCHEFAGLRSIESISHANPIKCIFLEEKLDSWFKDKMSDHVEEFGISPIREYRHEKA